MPNWCNTRYYFMGQNNEIQDFHKKVKEFISKDNLSNGFEKNWIGNIVNGFGYDCKKIPCRGTVICLDEIVEEKKDIMIFYIETETAWVPLNELWDKIIENFYPSTTYVFFAEEPGAEIYINSDKSGSFFPDRYKACFRLPIKEIAHEDYEFYSFSEKYIVDIVNKILKKKYKNLKQCKKRLQKEFKRKKYYEQGFYFCVYKFDFT